MPSINPALFERLKKELGVGRAAVYRAISDFNNQALEPNLAALALAHDLKVPLGKYSSPQERADLRPYLRSGVSVSVENSAPPSSGKATAQSRPKVAASRRPPVKDNSAFVVHGRNEALRKSMFDFLRSIGLTPLEWESAVAKAAGGNPYIGDVLRKAMEKVHVIVVLLSPDDEAKLKAEFCKKGEKTTEGKLQGQSRPNVLFEAGWAVGKFPEKTLLVQVGKVKAFTDISGKHMLHLSDDATKRAAFANRLKKFGCKVNMTGSDWLTAGKFKA